MVVAILEWVLLGDGARVTPPNMWVPIIAGACYADIASDIIHLILGRGIVCGLVWGVDYSWLG